MFRVGGCKFVGDTSNPFHLELSAYDATLPVFKQTPALLAIANTNTTSQYLIPEYTPVSDQLALNSCVANSSCDAFEIIKGIADPSNVQQLSRLFCYWNARLYSKQTNLDQGTYIAYAMQSLVQYGICLENTWKYDVNKVFAQPNQIAYKEADDNTFKASAFYKIATTGTDRLKDMEAAIRANHPVVFGTNVDQAFENYIGGNTALTPASSTLVGGHALVAVGVRYAPDLQFYIRNSWSSAWGIAGHVWFSASYMSWDQTNDLYVPTIMNNLLE